MSSGLSISTAGLDTESLIQSLMSIERLPLRSLEARQKMYLDKSTAWNVIHTRLESLSVKMAPLLNSSSFSQKTISGYDSSVLTASVSTGALLGQYDIEVEQLASAQVVQSSAFDSSVGALELSGLLTVNEVTVELLETDSLETIASKINATEDIGLKASVLQVASQEYRLVLTSNSTGVSNQMDFNLESEAWHGLGIVYEEGEENVVNQVRAAQDSLFSINGVSLTRSGNSVSDAITGVTFTLTGAKDPISGQGGKTVIEVGYNDQAFIDQVKSFVTEYNGFIDTVNKYNSWDAETKQAGLLFGDSTISRLMMDLRRVIGIEGPGSEFRTLGSVGISSGSGVIMAKDGKIQLDESKLKAALAQNRTDVSLLLGATRDNVALASNGATVSASSVLSPLYSADNVVNGMKTSEMWGSSGGGWSSEQGGFPHTLEIDFGAAKTIDRISLYTVNSQDMPASTHGLKDFSLEYWDGNAWVNIAGYAGNTRGLVTANFDAVTTDKVRVVVDSSNDGEYSRIVEVEVYAKNTGVLTALNERLQRYLNPKGILDSRKEELAKLDKNVARQIENLQRRLDMKLEQYKRQYAALELILNKFNSQSMWLTQQIDNLNIFKK